MGTNNKSKKRSISYLITLLSLPNLSRDVHAWISDQTVLNKFHHFNRFHQYEHAKYSSLYEILLPRAHRLHLSTRTTTVTKNSNNNNSEKEMGLNEIQTLLRKAVEVENYKEAARLRDLLNDKIESNSPKPGSAGKNKSEEDALTKRRRFSWIGLGTAPWLVERLEALKYILPTTIQIHAMESINSMLAASTQSPSSSSSMFSTMEERINANQMYTNNGINTPLDMSVVISGSTGSGKSLSYLVPLLSTLSESLFTRQRIRIKAEEDIVDGVDDLLSRVSIITSPTVSGRGRNQVGGGTAGATAGDINAAVVSSSLGKGDRLDVRYPLALIVVPTRELGVQTAMLLYQLVGGSVKKSATEFSGTANMFKYKGPKGVKIGCILDPEEAKTGLKLQTDIAITTPKYLSKLIDEKDIIPSKLRVICFDEADLALEQTPVESLKQLFLDNDINNDDEVEKDDDIEEEDDDDDDDDDDDMETRRLTRLTYLVGASVTEALADLPVKEKILPNHSTYIATSTSFGPLDVMMNDDEAVDNINATDRQESRLSLKQLRLNLDPGLIHERCIAPNNTGLLTLCRLLRQELKEYSQSLSLYQQKQEQLKEKQESAPFDNLSIANYTESIPKSKTKSNDSSVPPRPKVVIFFPTEEAASSSMSKLRDAMWGEHKLCVLLPETGVDPLSIMEQFKTNMTSVMLATSNSVRGLDFEGLTHVYTLYLPVDNPREYVHLAGRVGRIGQMGSVMGSEAGLVGGRVTSILKEEEADKMLDLAKALEFNFIDVKYEKEESKRVVLEEDNEDDFGDWEGINIEDMRRQFEDTLTLLDDSEADQ